MDRARQDRIVAHAMRDLDREYERLCTSWWQRIRRWLTKNF